LQTNILADGGMGVSSS